MIVEQEMWKWQCLNVICTLLIQVSVTVGYMSKNCTTTKMCLRGCLEDVKYQTLIYDHTGASMLKVTNPERKCRSTLRTSLSCFIPLLICFTYDDKIYTISSGNS